MERVAVISDKFDVAMNIHKKMFTTVMEKGHMSYRDFNNIINSRNDAFVGDAFDAYGWTYLCGTTVEQYKEDKWIIVMPEMVNIGTIKRKRR